MPTQPLKEQVTDTIQNIVGRDLTVLEQASVDNLFMLLIGKQNEHTDTMPQTWGVNEKKQYVNFRNTLRREQNIKYWYGMKNE